MRNVLITGATGGIGSEIAKQLAAKEYKLLLSGRDSARLNRLITELPGHGHSVLAVDLSEEEGINKLIQTSKEMSVDTLINCLGAGQLSLLEDIQTSELQNILNTNLMVPIRICHAFIPYFRTLSEATIVNVGSILGSIGYAGSTLYCASKFGLRGFSEALRRELADSQIKVVYFAPRATNTSLNSQEMNAMNKALGNTVDQPQLVAEQLTRLLARGRSTTRYLGWPEAFFVRLNSIFPGLVDQALKKQLSVIKHFARSGKTAH